MFELLSSSSSCDHCFPTTSHGMCCSHAKALKTLGDICPRVGRGTTIHRRLRSSAHHFSSHGNAEAQSLHRLEKSGAFINTVSTFRSRGRSQFLQILDLTDFLLVLMWPTWPQFAHFRCVGCVFLPPPVKEVSPSGDMAPGEPAPPWAASLFLVRFWRRALFFSSWARASSSLSKCQQAGNM